MWRAFIFLTIISKVCGDDPSTNDYCSKPCRDAEHTACKCTLEGDRELVDDDIVTFRQKMLDTHNQMRNDLASGKENGFAQASDMEALSYDMELEYVARCHAKKLSEDHDKCRNYFDGRMMGQNLAFNTAKEDPTNMVKRWCAEIKNTEPSDIREFSRLYNNGEAVGHFTQVIWAKTNRIGCARVWNPTAEFKFALVCNYGSTSGPPGNVIGFPVYTEGKPCSACECGDKKYPALCGKPEPAPTDAPAAATIENTCRRATVLLGIVYALSLLY